ncbi:MAG: hypothetical protein A3J38_07885 [Gammaproteobacteria bacterium RIFCSPHIGHO2_12_FULL_45_9]|nr:MAG: hypothetical protein A3J38_07885 [Gammaproteobacteria bacterium RIFCSPHIGHO2_12_FULL_45_9]
MRDQMANHLIGRDSEISTLRQILTSDKPEFLALYGRRRIGKTFLIRSFFETQAVFFFNVTGTKNGALREQIKHFTKQLSVVFYHQAPLENKKTWDDTLEMLTHAIQRAPQDKKIVLFLDELPWLATKNARFLQTLEYYWNQHWSRDARIKLIVCGSSASWIIKKIINNKGGLHNRVTHTMRLQPFNLHYTKQYLFAQGVTLNDRQILQLYMVTGGIPYYLSRIEKGLSASQIIEKLAFTNDSFLLKEFDNLFSSLFDEPTTYVTILRLIAKHPYGINQEHLLGQLDSALQGQGGIDKLTALEDAGFIMGLKTHLHKRRGKYYRLTDEYTLFYLDWIEPIRQTLQAHALTSGNWQEMQNTPAWNTWLGYAFESVCYKHIAQIRKKLAISPTAIANSWRYVPQKQHSECGAQIDLLFDRKDDSITLCEIKYSTEPFVIDKAYAKNLINKKETFVKNTRTKKQIFMAMITTEGIKDNLYADELINAVVILPDLFQE